MDADDLEEGVAGGVRARRNRNAEEEIDEVDDIEEDDEEDEDGDDDDDDDPQQGGNDAPENDNNNRDIVEGGIAEVDEPGKVATEADIVSDYCCFQRKCCVFLLTPWRRLFD